MANLHELIATQTMLVLAPSPGDESLFCGGLIAEACARGRPPLVAILTDGASVGPASLSGDARAAAHERETRAAVRALGLPPGRLLMLGVRDGEVPASGPFFDQVVDAIAFLTWMRDLNAICAPPADTPAGAIAAQIAQQTGITLLPYGPAATDLPLHPIAKANALAAHTHVGWGPPPSPWPWHAG